MSKKSLIIFFTGLIIGSVSLSYATWTTPTQTPPNGNTPAPINVGTLAQDKAGVLTLGGLGVFGSTLMTSTAGYTLPSSLQLGVNGYVGAKGYCDENGNNCVTTLGGSSSGGVGGWVNIPLDDVPFDRSCEYRFRLDTRGDNANVGGSNPVFYANAVDPVAIVYISHNQISHIMSASKSVYRLDGSPVYTVTKIEKRCGGLSSGSSGEQIITGWPNKILCDSSDQKTILYADGVSGVGYPEKRMRYSSFQDAGPHTSMHFNFGTGDYITTVGKTDAFGKAIDACIAKGNIKNQKGFN